MASGKSAYLEASILDLVFSATAWTPPATLYFALSTALFDAVTGPTEPVGSAYARASSTSDATEWPAASASPVKKANANDISFPSPTSSWGTIKSAYVFDALTGGHWLYGGDLIASLLVISGVVPTFSAGTLIFREV